MTAPARTAAYHAVRAIAAARADLPAALQASREHLTDDRDLAVAGDDMNPARVGVNDRSGDAVAVGSTVRQAIEARPTERFQHDQSFPA